MASSLEWGALIACLFLVGCGPDASVFVRDGICVLRTSWTGSTQLVTKRLPNGGVECTVIWEPVGAND